MYIYFVFGLFKTGIILKETRPLDKLEDIGTSLRLNDYIGM